MENKGNKGERHDKRLKIQENKEKPKTKMAAVMAALPRKDRQSTGMNCEEK
jgi:hypothetical protein